jgi:type II secretory pathway pseudopilin PulG
LKYTKDISMKMRLMKAAVKNQAGIGLVETLVAVAVLGTSVVAFVYGLSAGSIAVKEQDNTASTQRMAQTQMEYIRSYPYIVGALTYPELTAPQDYNISVTVNNVPGADSNIQKITVTVTREGAATATFEGYKVNR